MFPRFPLVAVGLLFACTAAAADWPTFRGPDRDGISKETGLLKAWPKAGPGKVWTARNLGLGHGAPVVAGGRVYGLGTREGKDGVWAVKESDGSELWFTAFDDPRKTNQNNGPSGSPTVHDGKVYAISSLGKVVCLDAAGKRVWQVDLVKEYGGRVPSWGYTETPLIDGDKLICTPGGKNTLVALKPADGKLIWKAEVPKADGVHYSSAVPAEIGGKRQYVQFVSGGVVSVAADNGAFLWRYDAPANRTANCSAPLVADGHVFAASAYGTGGGLAKVSKTGTGFDATQVYFDRKMQNHHGGMVLVSGYVYGADGGSLRCIEFKSGNVGWEDRQPGKGAVTYADGLLYFRSEGSGTVFLVEANPKEYVEKGRFTPPDRSKEKAWAYPVIANGRLYLRDQDVMHSYNVSGEKN